MGTIVNLPTQRRRRRISVRATEEATILFFMGVRYVRDIEPETPAEYPQAPVQHREEAAREFA